MYSLSLRRALGAARFFFLSFLALAVPAFCDACGISWTTPSMPFADDGSYRFVYWEKLGEISLENAKGDKDGKRLVLPINLGFSPAEGLVGTNNGLLGPGWNLALFESVLIPQDDKTFLLRLPDGHTETLTRGKIATQLTGAGWKGRIERNRTILQASCGWELIYDKENKLKRMKSPEGVIVEYLIEGKNVTKLRSDNKVLASLKSSRCTEAGQKQYELCFSDKKAMLKLAKRPTFTKLLETRELKSTSTSLVGIERSNLIRRDYLFNENGLRVYDSGLSGNQYFNWDEMNYLTRNDGRRYSIDFIEGVKCLVTTWDSGEISVFGKDWEKGLEIEKDQGTPDLMKIEKFPPSSALAGKLKARYLINKSKKASLVEKCFYDENGELLSHVFNGTKINYLSDGEVVMDVETGNVLSLKKFDKDNRIVEFRVGANCYNFNYIDDDNVEVKMLDQHSRQEVRFTVRQKEIKKLFLEKK